MDFLNFKSLVSTLFFFFIISCGIFAQGTVKGFIKDKNSGESIFGATVRLEEKALGASTNGDGYYAITKVPPGTYTVVVSSVGYESESATVTIDDNIRTVSFLLKSSVTVIGKVEISAEQEEKKNKVKISVQTLNPQDIKKIPSVGGQADIVQAIQVIPGVVTTGDQGGQLYIRGGSPVQNKVLLDGMIVYNPFHSIGLFSVFDVDIIKSADIYTGGFSGEYGGRISSIMDIKTRDGNKTQTKGRFGASPFGSKLTLEGPLKKLQDNGAGISYVLSAKTSYLEQSSKLLYTYIDEGGLPFNYTDLYGKINMAGGSGSKASFFGFRFTDQVKYQAVSDLNWTNWGVGGNFVVVPNGSSVLINGRFAKSNYKITLREDNLPERFSEIDGFNFGLDFNYNLGDDAISYGLEVVGFNTDFLTFNTLGLQVSQAESTTELGAFVKYRMTNEKLVLEPSFRLQYYASLAQSSPEPRLGFKFKASERFRLKGALGVYSQNLIAVNSDRDVVNLFYGFLAGPDNLQDELYTDDGDVKEITHRLQKANHYILGFEFDLTERISINLEGYYKDFRQLTNSNRNKIYADSFENNDIPDAFKKDFIIETGNAKGVDMVIKYEEKNTYFWFVYSLGSVDRWDGIQWYDPIFDRRHNMNIVFSRSFGENKDWEFSSRWNLGSGLPFTQIQGVYQPIIVDGQISDDFLTSNPENVAFQYAGINEGRLTSYHRLDLNVKKTLELKKLKFECNAGITNVYSRQNIFYYNKVTGEEVYQLPIMPSIGIEMIF